MFRLFKQYQFQISLGCLLIFYGIGLLGVLFSHDPQRFAQLSWLNLLISGIILFVNHKKWSTKVVAGILAVAMLGLIIEVIGVQTGEVFGAYYYGNALGVKWLGVPLVIALNWAMLCYCSVYTFSRWIKHWYVVPLVAALSLVFLDFIMEPVAVELDFWIWNATEIPLENFVAWFVLAVVFNKIIMLTKVEAENKIAPYLFLTQIVFFGVLRIFL